MPASESAVVPQEITDAPVGEQATKGTSGS